MHLCSPKLNGGIPSDELFPAEKNFIPSTEFLVCSVQPYTDQQCMKNDLFTLFELNRNLQTEGNV